MTSYSLNDSRIRIKLYSYLALIALGAHAIIVYIASNIYQSLEIFLSIPGYPIVFILIFYTWNYYLWKLELFKKIHNIPDLSGTWVGLVESEKSRNSGILPRTCEVNVNQSFSTIELYLDTELTHGQGIAFHFELGVRPLLKYIYESNKQNTPNASFIDKHDAEVKNKIEKYTENHKGVGDLIIHNSNSVTINYFTNLSKNHRGTIELSRKNS